MASRTSYATTRPSVGTAPVGDRPAEVPPADPDRDASTPADQAIEFIRAALDRSAAYSWPSVAHLLASGQAVRLKRRGYMLFYQWRKLFRPPALDTRAVEVELARRAEMAAMLALRNPSLRAAEGLTLAEFARLLGVDRRALGRYVVVVPPGPIPPLEPGQIPARRVGNTIRILFSDFKGEALQVGGDHGHHRSLPSPGSTRRETWDRQVGQLRHRRGRPV
ncbi:MAG: helix-turn-helix transcriptional regulator [Acidobacteria bacterium]|nr:helix-turn-helix transcriptional regulator [Acidobacteriota bacterium]